MRTNVKSSAIKSQVKKLQLIATKLVESLFAGNYRSVFRGPGIEFDEVREYVEGDEARLIDWNVSSRMGYPYTKVFREERELVLFLIVDMSSSVFSGSTELNRREVENILFALFNFAAIKNNDKVGAVLFTDTIEQWIPPRRGKKHALRLLRDMLSYTPQGKGSDMALALRTTGEALKRRGICVILSDFKTTNYFRELSYLARKNDVIAVRVTDPLDQEFPKVGVVHLEDPETGETIIGSGRMKKFKKKYQEFWHIHKTQWYRECTRRGVATLEVGTNEDPVGKLIQFFRRRQKR